MPGDGMAPGAGGLVRYVNRAEAQSLAAVGVFEMNFGQPFSAFLCRFVDSTGAEVNPSSVRVRLGLGALDVGASMGPNQPVLANVRDVIDPLAYPVFWIAGEEVRKLFVHVVTATAGILLEVTGIVGGAFPRFPTAAEIAAAIITAQNGVAQLAMANPAPVPMGAASATIVVANNARKYLSIQNVGAVNVYYRLAAAAAVVADNEYIPPGGELVFDTANRYVGEVRGITAGGAGAVVVQEGV